MDGIYFENDKGKQVFKEIIPTDQDIISLAEKIKIRVNRALSKKGLLEDNIDSFDNDKLQMDLLKTESIHNRVDKFQKPKQIGKLGDVPFNEFKGKKCAYNEGFSLHANVKILKNQRSSLEKLCRYISRGAVAKERISLGIDGNIILKLKTSYNDGTTHLEFTPEQFINRLITLIPPPRQNFIRYYGVFGARHKNRSEITKKPKNNKNKSNKKKTYRTPWAELLKRVFKYEVMYCDHCGTKLYLASTITSYSVCKKILNYLKIDSESINATSPRDPPEVSTFCEGTDFDSNQEYNW